MRDRKTKTKYQKTTAKPGKGLVLKLAKFLGFLAWLIEKKLKKNPARFSFEKNGPGSSRQKYCSIKNPGLIGSTKISTDSVNFKTNTQRRREKFLANYPHYQRRLAKLQSNQQRILRLNRKRKIWSFLTGAAALLILGFIAKDTLIRVGAATYTWVQTDWSGGASANVAVHPTNQSSWTNFSEKDAGVFTGTHLALQGSTSSITQTSDDGSADTPDIGGFDGGTKNNLTVDGSGSDASLIISSTAKDISESYPAGPTVEIALIREDCTGYSNCYTNLYDWNAALGGINFGGCANGNLVCANKIAVAKIDGTWSNPDDSNIRINGWTTGPNNYIRIYTTQEARHQGKTGTGYILKGTNWTPIFDSSADYITIDGLAIAGTESPTLTNDCLDISSVSGLNNSEIIVKNNLFYDCQAYAMKIGDGVTTKIYNNVSINSDLDAFFLSSYQGLYNLYLYNNTFYTSGRNGFRLGDIDNSSQIVLKNNLFLESVDDDFFNYNVNQLTATANNITSDNTSPNGVNYQNQTPTFVDANGRDLHLAKSDTVAKDRGVNLSADSYLSFSTDFDALSRTGTWDVGADEYMGIQEGDYQSSTIDLGASSTWDNFDWNYTTGENTTARVELAGNSDNTTWNYYPIIDDPASSGATQIYRSVGYESTSALASGASNAMTISGSTATFNSSLPDNIGVGDVIQYDSNGDSTVDTLAFVHGRSSSTSYTVKQADGSAPTEVTTETDWQIFRAYTSLANAEAGIENTAINSSLRNFDDWTAGGDASNDDIGKNLVSANQQWNIACYADNIDQSITVIKDWTTDSDNFVKIYTPIATNEVGTSQRHDQTVDGSGYMLRNSDGGSDLHNLVVSENYTEIDGLKIERTSSNWSYGSGIFVSDTSGDHQNNFITIKNCLLYQSSGGDNGSLLYAWGGNSGGYGHSIKNNFFVSNSDTLPTGLSCSRDYDTESQRQNLIYNNTAYGKFTDSAIKISVTNTASDTYKPLVKNNYASNTGTGSDFSLTNQYSNGLTNFGYNACEDASCGTSNYNQTVSLSNAGFSDTTLSTADLRLTANSSLRLQGIGPDSDTQVLNIDSQWHPRIGQSSDIGGDQYSTGNRAKTQSEFFMQGYRYGRFKVFLSTADVSSQVKFNDVSFDYLQYPTSATITSSIYDSGDAANTLANITWTESNTSATETIKFQMRTSPDNATWTDWLGPTGTGDYYQTSTGNSINSTHADTINDRYYQYKTFFASDGSTSPILYDVTATYVVNAPPAFESAPTATMDGNGNVNISYSIRDEDTNEGSVQSGFVTPSFEYSLDGGATWNAITTGLTAGDTDNKSVEEVAYTTHTATWHAENQINENYSTQARIRVTIDDAEAANHLATGSTSNFVLDTTNPTSPNLIVDSSSTPAGLTLSATDSSSLEMLIGLESDLSDGTWESFSTSSTITLETNPDTVYARFRDIYGNQTAIISATTPPQLENAMIQDTSNVLVTPMEYRLFIAWEKASAPTPGFGSYQVYRSQDQTNWSNIGIISDIDTNYFGDSTISGDTNYYYKITLVDADGNTSIFSSVVNGNANGVQDAGEGGGGSVTPDPLTSISGISDPPSVITDQDAIVTFNTDQSANCQVDYGTSTGNYTETSTESDYNKNHGVTLTSLSANTQYFYQITCEDSLTNQVISSEYSFTSLETQYSETEYLASLPAISAITDISDPPAVLTDEEAVITFQTDQSASCEINYGIATGTYTEIELEINQNYTHAITLESLSANTQYFYQITCEDRNSNTINSSEGNFTTLETQYSEGEFTASQDPLTAITDISDPPAVLTDEEAVITFQTDQSASCTLEYGTSSGNYTLSETETTYNILHAMVLELLDADSDYYYQITCSDANSNTVNSSQKDFTTYETLYTQGELSDEQSSDTNLASISSIKVSDITGESAKVTWSTSEEANSLVRYASDEDCLEDETCGRVAGNALTNSSVENYSTSHTVFIDGLVPGTKYFYIVTSINALGQVSKSSQKDFTTASFSSISSIEVKEISLTSATISWESSREISSILEYGLDSGYGKKIESNELTKIHSVTLSDLSQGETYHFLVKGKDADNKYFSSSDHTFVTKAPPAIEGPSVLGVKEDQAQVKFSTNVPTEALVVYEDVTTETGDYSGSQGNPSLAKNHDILLKNLSPGITYNLKIRVNDEEGNESETSLNNFTTLKDETPPQISHIKTESALTQDNQVQTIISWKTSEQTESVLRIKGNGNEEKMLPGSENPSTSHVAVITSLKPGNVYDYKISARDRAGNEILSKDYVILTPQKKENIIQIIITQFQDIFGWTKVIGN